jgi:hypothetical protein
MYLQIMDPHPTVVATKLLARREFIGTAKQFNLLATAWINFMIHDWVDHMEDTKQVCIKEHARWFPLFEPLLVLSHAPDRVELFPLHTHKHKN